MEAMIGMSRIADEYGLSVSIWYPAMDTDYSDPATVAFALEEWAEVFRQLPRIDAIFVPGGDPGHTHPRHLMPMLEQQAASLRRYHPTGALVADRTGISLFPVRRRLVLPPVPPPAPAPAPGGSP